MNKIDRYAIIFEPDQEGIMLHCYPGEGLELDVLQEIVDGYIETVRTMLMPYWAQEKGVTPVLIINEEGNFAACRITMPQRSWRTLPQQTRLSATPC